MGSFSASLKTLGERTGLPATIELDDGRLRIAAGEADIGDWPIADIGLEPTPVGYRLAAEGETLLIEITEREQFAEELARFTAKRPKRKTFKLPGLRSMTEADPTRAAETSPPRPEPTPPRVRPAEPVRSRRSEPSIEEAAPKKTPSESNAVVAFLDRTIDSTEKRWGPLLPNWVFNRAVFVGVAILVVLAFVFRGYTSIFLLILGVVALMIGGAAYTDAILASKLLPGRATPNHILIMGVGLLALGIGFGFIA